MLENKKLDNFQNFLQANFHQDIESVEIAIREILEEESNQYLQYAIEFIDEFLNEAMSMEEKKEFIIKNTYIYFECIGENPITWLKEVQQSIIKRVKEG